MAGLENCSPRESYSGEKQLRACEASEAAKDSPSDSVRKSGAQKQATTWLTPEQIERIRDASFTDVFPSHLQGRNETIISLLAETGSRVSELVAIDLLGGAILRDQVSPNGPKTRPSGSNSSSSALTMSASVSTELSATSVHSSTNAHSRSASSSTPAVVTSSS